MTANYRGFPAGFPQIACGIAQEIHGKPAVNRGKPAVNRGKPREIRGKSRETRANEGNFQGPPPPSTFVLLSA